MQNMEELLIDERQRLEKCIEKVQRRLKEAPEGHLRIRKNRGYTECYLRNEEDSYCSNGKYMGKEEMSLAKKIAQRDYDKLLLRKAEIRIKAMDYFLEKYVRTDLKRVYQETNPLRQKLLSEAILPDEEYAKQWEKVEYEGKPFLGDESELITERGERVRSKSEKIIADKLYVLGIPYRYEYPLVLDGGTTVFPDFTILKKETRQEIYLEHFGMMDDPDYVNIVLIKLNTYAKNKIYQGINLFITYENSKYPLNTRVLDDFLKKVFIT